jgi:transposase
VSVPPPVILKLMLLLFLYEVPSERERMRSLPYRLDWRWFLGSDLDREIPHHSVLSKARSRWGSEVFETICAKGISPCVQAGRVTMVARSIWRAAWWTRRPPTTRSARARKC